MATLYAVGGTPFEIDDEDIPRVVGHSWYINNYGYVIASIGGTTVSLAVMLVAEFSDCKVDHRDRNPLNNHKWNLRQCTTGQNRANSKNSRPGQYRGVYSRGRKWVAAISVNGKNKYLGTYDNPEAGARAYDREAAVVFGEFASLNFPVANRT